MSLARHLRTTFHEPDLSERIRRAQKEAEASAWAFKHLRLVPDPAPQAPDTELEPMAPEEEASWLIRECGFRL